MVAVSPRAPPRRDGVIRLKSSRFLLRAAIVIVIRDVTGVHAPQRTPLESRPWCLLLQRQGVTLRPCIVMMPLFRGKMPPRIVLRFWEALTSSWLMRSRVKRWTRALRSMLRWLQTRVLQCPRA